MKICPLQNIPCNKKCAWYDKEKEECIILQIGWRRTK